MKSLRFPLFLILTKMLFLTSSIMSTQARMFVGTIQFPQAMEVTPAVRIYHAGRKISTQILKHGNRITFTIPENKTIFYLIVTPGVEFVSQENIVKYLTLSSKFPVKVYVLELVGHDAPQGNQPRNVLSSLDKTPVCPWHIREVTPPSSNARIPDDAIIVYLDPEWISKIEGGNSVEFPRIFINPDIISQIGSEEKIHETTAQWLLAALNTDAIHGALEQEIVATPQSKKILAFNW